MPTLRHLAGGAVVKRYHIDRPVTVLGRDPSCDIVLEGTGVSRRHCALSYTKDGYCLEDLGSANGTMVGRETITGRVVLEDGAKIVVVGHLFEFTVAEDDTLSSPILPFDPNSLTPVEDDYDDTDKISHDEVNRRLDKLLEGKDDATPPDE